VVGSGAVLRLNFFAKIRRYAKPRTVSGYGKKKDRQKKPDKMTIFVKKKIL